MSNINKPVEIRIRGTEDQLKKLLNQLHNEFGSQIRDVSRFYKDRCADTYRVYVKVIY